MNAEPADRMRSDIALEFSRVLELYAAVHEQYRVHLALEKRVAAGGLEQDGMALAASEAKLAQLEAEIDSRIERMRKYEGHI